MFTSVDNFFMHDFAALPFFNISVGHNQLNTLPLILNVIWVGERGGDVIGFY